MNKKDVLKIARTIYLQNIVSKQLFAAYDPFKEEIDESLGSLRTSEKLSTCYQAFIGTPQRTPTIQFIKKQGMNFIVYKFDLNLNQITNQIVKTFTLRDLSGFLTTLQSFIVTNSGGKSLSKEAQQLGSHANTLIQFIDAKQNNKLQSKVLIIQNFYDQFCVSVQKLNKMISTNDNSFTTLLDLLDNNIQSLDVNKIEELKSKSQQISQAALGIYNILKSANVKKALDSITTNASRINMLSQIYDIVCNNTSKDPIALQIKTAIQTCDTIKDLVKFDRDLATENLQDYLKVFNRDYIQYDEQGNKIIDRQMQYRLQNGQRYTKNSLVSFLGGYLPKINLDNFENIVSDFINSGSISQQLKDKFKRLQQISKSIQTKIKNGEKEDYDIRSNDKTLFYVDFFALQPQLMNYLKQQTQYL